MISIVWKNFKTSNANFFFCLLKLQLISWSWLLFYFILSETRLALVDEILIFQLFFPHLTSSCVILPFVLLLVPFCTKLALLLVLPYFVSSCFLPISLPCPSTCLVLLLFLPNFARLSVSFVESFALPYFVFLLTYLVPRLNLSCDVLLFVLIYVLVLYVPLVLSCLPSRLAKSHWSSSLVLLLDSTPRIILSRLTSHYI